MYKWVTGVPTAATSEAEDKFAIGAPYVDVNAKKVLVPISLSDNTKYIYSIDPTTAVATQGSKVIAEGVSAIGKLSYNKE